MQLQPGLSGEPGYAPASYIKVASAAVILPSLVAPIFINILVPDVGPVPSKTSARDIVIFTGRPDFLERMEATGSR